MTSFRVEEFDLDDDVDTVDASDLSAESRVTYETAHIPENQDDIEDLDKVVPIISEVVEPKIADNTRKFEKPLEISPQKRVDSTTEKIVFKTKCHLMQEEIENGE